MIRHCSKNIINTFLYKLRSIPKMSIVDTASSLLQIESRAVQTDNLIILLQSQLSELTQLALQSQDQSRLQELEIENRVLSEQIEQCKEELIQLQVANGRRRIPLTTETLSFNEVNKTGSGTPNPVEISKHAKAAPETDEKPKKAGKKDAEHPAIDEPVADVGRLDLRVGRIMEVKKHPGADSLYVEQIDIGQQKLLTVVSGLVKHVPMDDLLGRLVIVLCNMKPAKMRGIVSEAMVMCASTPNSVEVLIPPPASEPGDVILFEGYPHNPDTVLNPKKKVFETVAPDLKTNAQRVATYKGVEWTVLGKGVVTASSLVDASIR